MMPRRSRSKVEKEVDAELEAKTKEELLADFDESQALHVPAKKRESKLISIRLPITMMNDLRDLAIKRGDVGYQQLIKIFIADGLLRSQYETSSFAVGWLPRLRIGDWGHLDNSFSPYVELQTPTVKTGGPRWK